MTATVRVEHRSAKTGGSDMWRTPQCVLDIIDDTDGLGPISIDPCASDDRAHWFAEVNIDAAQDGLATHWAETVIDPATALVFVNPPYSKAEDWLHKCTYEHALNGFEVVALLRSSPGSKYWHRHVWPIASAIAWWRGRLRFVGAPSTAPFPSALVYYGDRPWIFETALAPHAAVVRL